MKELKSKILFVGPSTNLIGGVAQCIKTITETKVSNFYDIVFYETSVNINGSVPSVLVKKIKESVTYVKRLFSTKPDIVHIHSSAYFSFFEKSLLGILAKIWGSKVVFHIHGDDFKKFYFDSGLAWIIKIILRLYDKVIFVEDDLPKLIGLNNGTYLPNMVKMPCGNSIHLSTSGSDEFYFLSVSVIEDRKRIDLIVKATQLLIEEGYRFKTVIAGHGPKFNDIQKVVDELNIAHVIELVGPVSGEEKDKIFLRSDAFILASRSESFGIVIAEAMSFGLDVISTPVGIVPNVNEKIGTIHTFEIDSLEELMARMKEVLEKDADSRRKSMVKNIDFCEKNFSLSAVENRLLSVYSEVL